MHCIKDGGMKSVYKLQGIWLNGASNAEPWLDGKFVSYGHIFCFHHVNNAAVSKCM